MDLPDIWFPDQQGNTPKSKNTKAGPQDNKASSSEPVLIEQIIGGAKALINRAVKANASMQAQWYAEQGIVSYRDSETGETLSDDEVIRRFEEHGPDILEPDNPSQEAGAKAVDDHAQTATVVAASMAVLSRGRSLARDSDEAARYIAEQVKKATTDTRSVTEAMGKAGMQQAKERMGIKTDPRYVDRYHGPDNIGLDKNGKLTEIEAKGSYSNSTAVAVNKNKEKQSSKAKNNRRAKQMTSPRKKRKINHASSRQGGAYTHDEYDLWQEIIDLKGEKRHLSTHTNTETGKVRVLNRNKKGETINTADEFTMDNFQEIRKGISDFFKG